MALNVELQPKQSELLRLIKETDHTIIGYGGSKGGSKSHAVRDVNLILCVENKSYPIKTLIIRRNSTDLLENHIIPFFQKYPELEKFFNKSERIIYWPDGSTTKFGCADNEADIYNFEGKEYDYIFVDEATHFTQIMLEFLLSRNRSGHYLAKIIMTMNPGYIGHNYVKRIFITRNYLEYEDPKSYVYLPARVWDNVIWSERELVAQGYSVEQYYYEWNEDKRKNFTLQYSDYAKNLTRQPLQKRKAWLYGDWDIFEGQFFDEWNPEVHIIQKPNYLSYSEIKQFKVLSALDYGNVSSGAFLYKDWYGNVFMFDNWHDEGSTRDRKAEKLSRFMKERELYALTMLGDTNLWVKDAFDVEKSNVPANAFINAFKKDGLKIRFEPVSKNPKGLPGTSIENNRGYRIACNDSVKNALHYEIDENGKFIVKPKFFVYERCTHFIETFPALIADPDNPEDIEEGQDDHDYDAMKMAFMSIYTPRKVEQKKVFNWQLKLEGEKKKLGILAK